MKYKFPLITVFIWGSLYVVSKYAYSQIPPMTVLFLRYAIAAVPLGIIAWKSGFQKIEKSHWKYFFLLGSTAYCGAIGLQMMATSMMDASIASLINSMNPIFLSLMAVLILKEKMTLWRGIGIACTLIGVVVVVGIGRGEIPIIGVLLSVCSVTLWSLSSVLLRKISANYSGSQMAFMGVLFALPFCFVASFVELQTQTATFTPSSIMAILYIGIFCTCLSNITWNLSLKNLEASTCSLFYPLQPVFSAILGIVVLRETISINFITGALMITVGILVGIIGPKLAPKATSSLRHMMPRRVRYQRKHAH